jgi:hypothetical protein
MMFFNSTESARPKRSYSDARLLPFPVIKKAVSGDAEAINAVLKHYEGYITKICTKRLYDENGAPHTFVDNDMRRLLETKLITKILDFKINEVNANAA